jgi:lysophospholipase L1-like esterase
MSSDTIMGMLKYKIFIVVVIAVVILLIVQIVLIKYGGESVPAPKIQKEMNFGDPKNKKARYLILGDSTTVGQGADYKDSYAYMTAQHLSSGKYVELLNVGVSGARVADVRQKQLIDSQKFTPNIVLLAVGANDVTHLTRQVTFERDLRAIIEQLKARNPDVKIIVTGVPAMGSVHRFPWPTRQLAGLRTDQLNAIYDKIILDYSLTHAPIAEKTRGAFASNPQYLAKDKFHPNAQGYMLWTTVINSALDVAVD